MVTLCTLGAWISGELIRVHAGPWPSTVSTPGVFSRFCDAGSNGQSDCAKVMESDWSAVDFDIPVVTRSLEIRRVHVVVPVAFIGLSYFVFVGVWYAFSGLPASWGRTWRLVPLVTVLAGSAGSAVLVGIMFFVIDSSCFWCLMRSCPSS